MCRGDRRENIFEDDADRVRFLETLGQACRRTGWKIHVYVLMSNHYHWLLETPRPNLVAGMGWFQSCFTARYNRPHRKVGHLFQGRYKAMLVEAGSGYFLRLWPTTFTLTRRVRASLAAAGAGQQTRLCEDCRDRPCLSACPVSAFAPERPYDYAACRQYLEAGEADCLTRACAARRACPIGPEMRYSEQQAAFHIRAFLGNRLG